MSSDVSPAGAPMVFVPGGAGYVGAVLVPALLDAGYRVRVLDLYLYGHEPLAPVRGHPNLEEVTGDVRDLAAVRAAVAGCAAVIHLACISNDPSVELDPGLSQSVNYDSFGPLVRACKEAGVRRFVFASSGSVYGVSDSPNVTEEHPLVPVSLYNKFKAMCEPVLLAEGTRDFVPVIVRPATICGHSPRQRLDLTVNILTNHAINNGKITVFGGVQMRPNLHIRDMIDLYLLLLTAPDDKVGGEIFNAGYQNYTVAETAEIVRGVVQREVPERGTIEIVTTPSDDIRSYRVNADKVRRVLGFVPKHTIEDAAVDLIRAFRAGRLPNSMTDPRYFNIKLMKDKKVA
ncbi:udp-glucose 4-epimerase : NAD-dependent epimerase/dehydratase OS=alpha proteobacterium BAL199 GN=BAL199_07303 PE=4 SV=1: Epimerase [Gemmata massiliana]|uniref:NAD-dependent epimerase/dehydratase domain-containing protein n=1 Tax=Gemmata massiliana TaxID=1210884 RepID=A0A6P2CXM5_9BACT|nr:SDR family oxidoreductase [Gemmata massiliana]VTR93888.1 udp-glucose 4-epimerase : NAD-dependent epimerase/dehydratase OS=alpha proteobacterium BAL199 GN=BAL199_07303 PE=4 SV=1: Epimerase [Gemmata massiliana]